MSANPSTRAASKSPRPRERAAHLGPERRRPLVLDAAFELFLEHGYDGTSMEAVARAAGVSKPVVYDCFASKEELFTALLRREETRVLGQIAAALPRRADGDDAGLVLGDALTAFLRAVADSPQAYRVIFLGEGGANAAVAASTPVPPPLLSPTRWSAWPRGRRAHCSPRTARGPPNRSAVRSARWPPGGCPRWSTQSPATSDWEPPDGPRPTRRSSP